MISLQAIHQVFHLRTWSQVALLRKSKKLFFGFSHPPDLVGKEPDIDTHLTRAYQYHSQRFFRTILSDKASILCQKTVLSDHWCLSLRQNVLSQLFTGWAMDCWLGHRWYSVGWQSFLSSRHPQCYWFLQEPRILIWRYLSLLYRSFWAYPSFCYLLICPSFKHSQMILFSRQALRWINHPSP